MTHKQIASMIESAGFPYAYYQFPEGTAQAPPFVVFFYSEIDDVYADNSNYQRIEQLNIELYTSEKDFTAEATLENVLKNNGFSYHKYESYVDSEKMYQIAYETQVLIDES